MLKHAPCKNAALIYYTHAHAHALESTFDAAQDAAAGFVYSRSSLRRDTGFGAMLRRYADGASLHTIFSLLMDIAGCRRMLFEMLAGDTSILAKYSPDFHIAAYVSAIAAASSLSRFSFRWLHDMIIVLLISRLKRKRADAARCHCTLA